MLYKNNDREPVKFVKILETVLAVHNEELAMIMTGCRMMDVWIKFAKI